MNKTLITGIISFLGGVVLVVIILTLPDVFPLGGLTASVASALTSGNGIPGQIACGRIAINAREQAVVKANMAYEQTVNAAYKARGIALSAAYTGSSWTNVTKGINTAFTSFLKNMTAAQATLKSADQKATNSYSAAITVCQANNPVAPPTVQLPLATSTSPVPATSTSQIPSTVGPSTSFKSSDQ